MSGPRSEYYLPVLLRIQEELDLLAVMPPWPQLLQCSKHGRLYGHWRDNGINDEIRRLKAKHNKPVYAVVQESLRLGCLLYCGGR